MKKIKKIIVSIMLVFVLGTGMNITSTFNTVDVRAASVEKTEDEKIWRDSEKFAKFIKDEIKISYKKENCTAEVISETPWEDDATMYIILVGTGDTDEVALVTVYENETEDIFQKIEVSGTNVTEFTFPSVIITQKIRDDNENTEAVEILQGLIDEGGNASTTKDDIKYTLSADAENFKFVIEPEVEQ